ncbi:MAG: methyltransferase domain-containing protein [Geminicoccaceae bacterium]
MTKPVANTDFTEVDKSADAAHFVRHLDRISGMAQVQAYKHRTFDLLQVREGSRVLDVGCGTGDDARSLAERVGVTGLVIGLDSSEALLQEARKRADGLGLPVEYHLGDARRLNFPEASFDACRIDRVLHHLDDPQAAVDELVRVAKPGAQVVMHEPDQETNLVGPADRSITRRVMNYFCDRHPSGWVGRQLHALARQAGLAGIAIEPDIWVWTNYEEAMRILWLERTAADAANAGSISEREADSWLAELRQAGATGGFFAAAGFFILSGHKV